MIFNSFISQLVVLNRHDMALTLPRGNESKKLSLHQT